MIYAKLSGGIEFLGGQKEEVWWENNLDEYITNFNEKKQRLYPEGLLEYLAKNEFIPVSKDFFYKK